VRKRKVKNHTKRNVYLLLSMLAFATLTACSSEADPNAGKPQSASGVVKASAHVEVGPDGMTAEQRNVKRRVEEDNRPGAIKHLYIISAYSGQVILYSTVDGKVTSGGKRLTPASVTTYNETNGSRYGGFAVNIGNEIQTTTEVLGDDGTYGSSGEYIYWWDQRGVYHQHYMTGGQLTEITSAPMAVKSIIINIEESAAKQ
jgi:hypothetical protein